MPKKTGTRTYGKLRGGMPFLSFGTGEPLVFLPGLTPHHEPPVGTERMLHAAQVETFADRRRVWWINRRPGLAPDATMADLAGDYAEALRGRFGEPVDIVGFSTGGSIALQLAADHPSVVKRLIIVAAAYRLGPVGAAAQRRVAREVQAGRPREAGAEIVRTLGGGVRAQRVLGAAGWLMGKSIYGKASADMIATINAEDDFNLRTRLGEISAPTLVVAGEKDPLFSEDLCAETAALVPNGRFLLYDGKGHLETMMNAGLAADVFGFLDAQDVYRGDSATG